MAKEQIEQTKDIQQTILPQNNPNKKISEDEIFSVLKSVSPGTNLRTALEGILRAKRGAIIVIDNENLLPLIDGGFRVNCKFTPQRLVELGKMDGAIILSKDMKKIDHANVLLTPDNKIKSYETGARHKAAERTARQAGCLVIAISERKGEINLFYKNTKNTIEDTNSLLRKVNEYMQLLEKQKDLFENHTEKLNKIELKNTISLNQAVSVIQKGRLVSKIAREIKRYLIELGNESTLLKTRFKELISGVDKEMNLVIKDYTKLNLKKTKILLESLSYEEILDKENIYKALGYIEQKNIQAIKGWRILSKTSLHDEEISKIIKESNLGQIIDFGKNQEKDNKIAGLLGEEKAKTFIEELRKIRATID